MTSRAQFDKRMRRIMSVVRVGVALFLLGIVLGEVFGQEPLMIVWLPGFAIAFGAMVFVSSAAFRCPKCRGNLGNWVLERGWFGVSAEVRFCPYCGCSLDDEEYGAVADS